MDYRKDPLKAPNLMAEAESKHFAGLSGEHICALSSIELACGTLRTHPPLHRAERSQINPEPFPIEIVGFAVYKYRYLLAIDLPRNLSAR
jgi:hypothetical protein